MFIFAQGKKRCPTTSDVKETLKKDIIQRISKYHKETTKEKLIKAQTDIFAAGVYSANKEKLNVCNICLSALDSENRRESLEVQINFLRKKLCDLNDNAWAGVLSSQCYDLASRTLQLITDEHNESLGSDEVRRGGVELQDNSGPLAPDARVV